MDNPEQSLVTCMNTLFDAMRIVKAVRSNVVLADIFTSDLLLMNEAAIYAYHTGRTEQAREIGISWERMPEPRPRVTLELFTPAGQEQIFYLGPHAPRLTEKEIELIKNAKSHAQCWKA